MTFDTLKRRLGQRLVGLREQASLTQEEVARRAGITRQHLQRLEYGSANPTLETLFALAPVYRTTVARLVDL